MGKSNDLFFSSECRKISSLLELDRIKFRYELVYTSFMMYNMSMDKQWDVEFYSDKEGNCEIAEWIMKLKVSQRDKVIAWIDKLQEMDPLLPRPYADLLRDGIHELRMKVSGNQVVFSISLYLKTQ